MRSAGSSIRRGSTSARRGQAREVDLHGILHQACWSDDAAAGTILLGATGDRTLFVREAA